MSGFSSPPELWSSESLGLLRCDAPYPLPGETSRSLYGARGYLDHPQRTARITRAGLWDDQERAGSSGRVRTRPVRRA